MISPDQGKPPVAYTEPFSTVSRRNDCVCTAPTMIAMANSGSRAIIVIISRLMPTSE